MSFLTIQAYLPRAEQSSPYNNMRPWRCGAFLCVEHRLAVHGRLIKRSSIIVQLCRLINPPAIMSSPSLSLSLAVLLVPTLPLSPPLSLSLFVRSLPRRKSWTGPYPPFHNLRTLTRACCNVGTTAAPHRRQLHPTWNPLGAQANGHAASAELLSVFLFSEAPPLFPRQHWKDSP